MDHSEVKHLPKVDHTPAEMDEASRVLLHAADVIERRGWCQDSFEGRNGSVCATRAFYQERPQDRVTFEAIDRLRNAVGGSIFGWNDTRGRTKEEVVAKIRAIALGLSF